MKTSVALCTYNGEKFLKEQIDSILAQSMSVDEIVVCDDGSTDETVTILNKYKEKYPNIFRIYINDKNLRSTKNFQKALSLCSGEVIFLCDQDDVWLKNKVEEFIKVFLTNPHIRVIASNGNYYNGKEVLTDKLSVWDIPKFISEEGISESIFFELISAVTNISTGAAMALKKEFLVRVPPFPSIKNIYHDEYIAMIAASKNEFYFLDKKLFNYRIHPEQQVGLNFFDIDNQKINYLLKPYKQNKSFSDYKQLLKTISRRYKLYNYILKNNKLDTYYYDLFSQMRKICENIFYLNKSEMQKKFPIQSIYLNFADYITKKRTL